MGDRVFRSGPGSIFKLRALLLFLLRIEPGSSGESGGAAKGKIGLLGEIAAEWPMIRNP